MNLKALLRSVIQKHIPDDLVRKYQQNVIDASLDIRKVPKTSLTYKAYEAGLWHGIETMQNAQKARGFVEYVVTRCVELKVEDEEALAKKAAEANGIL